MKLNIKNNIYKIFIIQTKNIYIILYINEGINVKW